MWLGEIAAFLVIFLAVVLVAGLAARIVRHIVKGSWTQFCRPNPGRSAGAAARNFDGGSRPYEHGRVHAYVDVA